LLGRKDITSIYSSFEDLHAHRQTYVDRIGPPDECSSAIGHIFIGFSWLEESLERHIHALGNIHPSVAPILTAELSFKGKVAVLSGLVLLKPALRQFNVGSESTDEVWRDFTRMLCQCEELRNRVAHSHWSLPRREAILRTKRTSKPTRGLHVASEAMDSGHLLDIYDYILHVDIILDEFFL
jgi:hypothetical protein